MSNDFESRCRTTGIVHSYNGRTGEALVSFSATAEEFAVPVDGMRLAQEGIDLTADHVFSAVINLGAATPELVCPSEFQAMEQLRPGDTLDSVTIQG